MRSALWIAVLACIAAIGCRSPSTEPVFDPDAGEFDASIEDDAGPGELCPPGAPDLFNNTYSPFMGGEGSVDLEVAVFASLRCIHCAEFSMMWKGIWDTRPDIRARVRLYYHHFPPYEADAWKVHASAVAAGKQGMEHFWALHDHLYQLLADENVALSSASVRAYCDEVLHLDMAQFDEDVADPYTDAFLEWDKAQGDAGGVAGTPSVFVCGEKIGWGSLEEVIDGYLNE